ncbi:hypothetical protein [Streptomyces kronopolitis]|uniref:hypothetical protein n=1 Tax=Streptomyces kronopolitis TaxID=1612435 RepID=UPI0020BDAB91|nr:hypothetical protein [Streptomyces kronopolitis]MCL6302822.1 hypothetical protein [Streptomyces kronopolitis]
MTEHNRDQVADFDAFFAEQNEVRFGATLRLYGREYVLPTALPLLFTLQMDRVQSSSDPEDIRRLLSSLFGPKALDDWADQGMDDRQLGIVLLWSAANAREPGCISIPEAVKLYDEQQADGEEGGEGKAPHPTPKTIADASGKQS